jgi:Protein of unknown function (DUF1214)
MPWTSRSSIPARAFWSVVLYDTQTRSMLQTDQQFPSTGSQNPALRVNPDGSCVWGAKTTLAASDLQLPEAAGGSTGREAGLKPMRGTR